MSIVLKKKKESYQVLITDTMERTMSQQLLNDVNSESAVRL